MQGHTKAVPGRLANILLCDIYGRTPDSYTKYSAENVLSLLVTRISIYSCFSVYSIQRTEIGLLLGTRSIDYLNIIKNLAFQLLKVPCLCKEEYGSQEFLEYPNHQGWSDSELCRAKLGRGGAEAAAVLQKWLHFGVLHVCLGPTIKRSDFGHTRGGRDVIVSTHLFRYRNRNFRLDYSNSTPRQFCSA